MKKLTISSHTLHQQGFTLLELMIVLIITAVLAAIAIPSYQAYIVRSQRASAEAQMQRIAAEMNTFRSKNLSYATFDPTYLYGSSVDSATHSQITLPVGAVGKDIQYTLTIYDISVPPASGTNPPFLNTGVGRQWAIVGVINSANNFSAVNYNLLLSSTGTKCMTKNTISTPFSDCGNGSIDW